MVSLTIDDKETEVPEGSTVLEAAHAAGIDIPTLCFHAALTPYGACRLCQVEVVRGASTKLVAACVTPADKGLVVRTKSDDVMAARRMVLELLLGRCPDVKEIQDLAREYGVLAARFMSGNTDCILCGLCVRVCREVVGADAIGLVNRGADKVVGAPFNLYPIDCVSCGCCLTICPTGVRELEDMDGNTVMHNFDSQINHRQCRLCGAFHLQPEFIADYRDLLDEAS